MRIEVFVLVALSAVLAVSTAQAQHTVLNLDPAQDDLLGFYLPKIAVAADGSYGIAAEALFRTSTGREVLRVVSQRYSSDGVEVGPTHVFSGESCSTLDLWDSDYQSRPEIAFHPGGLMLVLMQHTGQFVIGTDAVSSAELTLSAIEANGQVRDLANSEACEQAKFYFPGGSRQDRPRFDLTPDGAIFLTADGFFNDADLRNVAIRVLDADGNEVIEQVIPHEDVGSEQSYHQQPDIATNGSIMLSTWHRCSWDAQGNTDDCDVEAQFAGITDQGLQAIGGNQRVNAGDPPGTVNIWASAAMNAAGQSVVAWADARDSFEGDIYAQRYDANGQPLGGNLRVSDGQGAIDERPEVAILDNGRFMIVWTDSSGIGYRARGRVYDPFGVPEGAPFELAPGEVSGQPAVSADGAGFAYVHLGLENGTSTLVANKASSQTAAEDVPGPASEMTLSAAYPNPFTDHARVTYELPSTGHVTLRVYDVLGREVARLVDAHLSAGTHDVILGGATIPPGLYVLDLQIGGQRRTVAVVRGGYGAR